MIQAPTPGRRVGLLGGTFDPVHHGHLQLARAAMRRFGLDWVYFVPARRPWHKSPPRAEFEDRFAMVALALARTPRFQPLAIPAVAGRPTYSLDQARWLLRRLPRGTRLFFLIGADAFRLLPSWHEYGALLRLCEFIVAPRDGVGAREAAAVTALAPGRVHWLSGFARVESSRALRSRAGRAAAGGSEAGRAKTGGAAPPGGAPLPAAVAAYIRRAGLYSPRAGSGRRAG